MYVLFEHKSYSEPLIGLDLLRYLVRIWEQVRKAGTEKTLPVIVPMVVYHGRTPWRIEAEFASLVAPSATLTPYVPNFRYVLVDLSVYPEQAIRGEVMLRTALLVLKYIFRDELRERLPKILGLLRDLVRQRTGLEYLETLLRYVVRGAGSLKRVDLHQAVVSTFARGDDIMTTIADEWVQEGIQQGIEQGIPLGEARVLKRLLVYRFGKVPAWVEAKLTGADQASLERWVERVLEATTLEAVFAEED